MVLINPDNCLEEHLYYSKINHKVIYFLKYLTIVSNFLKESIGFIKIIKKYFVDILSANLS